MKDILKDIVSHTHSLGFITILKVTAEDTTVIEAMTEDRSVIMKAVTKTPVGEFIGTFGMPDLGKLAYHLKNPEYKDNATIEVVQDERNGVVLPTHMHFKNSSGDFQNDYCFMNTATIEEKLKSATYNGKSWEVEIEPSLANIARMKLMAGAHSEESVFRVKIENGDLNFYFGDSSTHAGKFTFHRGISGKLSHVHSWPVAQTIAILELNGDKVMSITGQGAMKISVNSGMATYDYILPAQVK